MQNTTSNSPPKSPATGTAKATTSDEEKRLLHQLYLSVERSGLTLRQKVVLKAMLSRANRDTWICRVRQQELAQLAKVSEPTVSRALRALEPLRLWTTRWENGRRQWQLVLKNLLALQHQQIEPGAKVPSMSARHTAPDLANSRTHKARTAPTQQAGQPADPRDNRPAQPVQPNSAQTPQTESTRQQLPTLPHSNHVHLSFPATLVAEHGLRSFSSLLERLVSTLEKLEKAELPSTHPPRSPASSAPDFTAGSQAMVSAPETAPETEPCETRETSASACHYITIAPSVKFHSGPNFTPKFQGERHQMHRSDTDFSHPEGSEGPEISCHNRLFQIPLKSSSSSSTDQNEIGAERLKSGHENAPTLRFGEQVRALLTANPALGNARERHQAPSALPATQESLGVSTGANGISTVKDEEVAKRGAEGSCGAGQPSTATSSTRDTPKPDSDRTPPNEQAPLIQEGQNSEGSVALGGAGALDAWLASICHEQPEAIELVRRYVEIVLEQSDIWPAPTAHQLARFIEQILPAVHKLQLSPQETLELWHDFVMSSMRQKHRLTPPLDSLRRHIAFLEREERRHTQHEQHARRQRIQQTHEVSHLRIGTGVSGTQYLLMDAHVYPLRLDYHRYRSLHERLMPGVTPLNENRYKHSGWQLSRLHDSIEQRRPLHEIIPQLPPAAQLAALELLSLPTQRGGLVYLFGPACALRDGLCSAWAQTLRETPKVIQARNLLAVLNRDHKAGLAMLAHPAIIVELRDVGDTAIYRLLSMLIHTRKYRAESALTLLVGQHSPTELIDIVMKDPAEGYSLIDTFLHAVDGNFIGLLGGREMDVSLQHKVERIVWG